MRATLWQQQVQNLNLFTKNLANHLNIFFKRLEEANNDKSIPVTNNETSKHWCSKVIANTLPNLIVGGGLLSRGVGILLQIYRLGRGGDNK